MRAKAFMVGLIGLALFSSGVAVSAQEAVATGEWTRVAVPSGMVSLETHCDAGKEKTLTRSDAEGVRCLEQDYEVGVVVAPFSMFGAGQTPDDPFEFLFEAFSAEERTLWIERSEVAGFSAFHGVGEASDGMTGTAFVDLGTGRTVVVLVRATKGRGDEPTVSALLRRAVTSLEISSQEVAP